MQELCKSHYPGWGICYGYVESFRQFCQAEISLFSPPSTTYLPHETRKAACISAASDAQPRSLSLLRGQRKHALRPLHNREYAANCPFSVARTHRFRHRKSPDSDFSFERNSGPVLPWAQGARASPPAPRTASKDKRRVCHGFHDSSSSQNAGPRASGNASNAVPDAVEDPLLSPGITGYREAGAHLLRRKVKGSKPDPEAMPHASHCKLLLARTEPIRSALFSRAGNSRGPWQRQALSSVRRTCPQSPCAGQGSRRCRDQGQCQSP